MPATTPFSGEEEEAATGAPVCGATPKLDHRRERLSVAAVEKLTDSA
jgi:hypothetical protein